MKFLIKHEIRGRIRIHFFIRRMTGREADTFLYYIQNQPGVIGARVYERTADAAVLYDCSREEILQILKRFSAEKVHVPDGFLDNSARELNAEYKEKLIQKTLIRAATKCFLPVPAQAVYNSVCSIRYLWKGLRCLARGRLEVEVLDAAAIGVSVFRGNYNTAGSIMFLLGIGELLEEWTHKKSVGDLARSMSLKVTRVWKKVGGQEILVSSKDIAEGDEVVVHMGNVIPFDGVVTEGEAMVNQSSMTGESLPVQKNIHKYVYAGTVVEEGELTISVKAVSGSTRYESIVRMIEESEKLKSSLESRAESLADRLVPWTLGGTALTYLLTRNTARALAVLMVDFSCALKLAMPVSVLSAIREAGAHHMTVKGGKYMEAVADATVVVFDKTGTLTRAKPTVKDVVVFRGGTKEDLLRVAACLEEHFPHSMAKAVVQAARSLGLDHEEMHSRVNYVVAHGISSSIDDKKVVIGSYHFVFEDEQCRIPDGKQELFDSLPTEYSHLYMAVDHQLAAVICIEDPLREEATEVIRRLKKAGIRKVVMMTGDSERTASAIAEKIGVDEYYSEVLPQDKAAYIEKQKAAGETVIMVGDGINDSPALSAADVGIAVSDGAEIAREIADVTVSADELEALVTLKSLSDGLMRRIHSNYRSIVGINGALIALGVAGIITPSVSALCHNTSTLAISLKSMRNLL